jgi:hypothetical protein
MRPEFVGGNKGYPPSQCFGKVDREPWESFIEDSRPWGEAFIVPSGGPCADFA